MDCIMQRSIPTIASGDDDVKRFVLGGERQLLTYRRVEVIVYAAILP